MPVPWWFALLVVAAAAGLLAAAAAATLAVRIALAAARARFRRELADTMARWALLQEEAAPERLVESFTLGWLNLILRFLWTPVLEKHIAGLAMELLQRALNEALERHAGKAPWRYIALGTVESLTLGMVPPALQYACVRYDPGRQLLSFAFDISFDSSGAQGVVLLRLKPNMLNKRLSGRFEAMHLHLHGRMHIGVQFTHEAPGIKGIYYSFARQPDLEVHAQPLGASGIVSELLPGIVSALKALLARPVRRRLVEPQRRFFDVQRAYRNRHAKQAGGPGGLLQVVLVRGHNIVSTEPLPSPGRSSSPAPAAAGSSTVPAGRAGLAAYAQLRAGRRLLRTPLVHRTAEPVWQWSFSIPLPAPIGTLGPRDASITLEVCDAKTIGEPSVLGRAQLKLADLGLEPNGRPQSLTVALLGRPAPVTGGPTMDITLQWLQAPPRRPDPFQQAEAREAAMAAASGAEGTNNASPPLAQTTMDLQKQQEPQAPPQPSEQDLPLAAANTPSPLPSNASVASLPVLSSGMAVSTACPSPPLGRLSAPASPSAPSGPVRRASTHRRIGSTGAAGAQPTVDQRPASEAQMMPLKQPGGSRWSVQLRPGQRSSEGPGPVAAAAPVGAASSQQSSASPHGEVEAAVLPTGRVSSKGLLTWFKGRSWRRRDPSGLAAAASQQQNQWRHPSKTWAAATPSPVPAEDLPLASSPRVLLHADSDGRMLVRHTTNEAGGDSGRGEMWGGDNPQSAASVSEDAVSGISGPSQDEGSTCAEVVRSKGALSEGPSDAAGGKEQRAASLHLAGSTDSGIRAEEHDSWALRAHPAGLTAASSPPPSWLPVSRNVSQLATGEGPSPLALLALLAHQRRQQQGAAEAAAHDQLA